MGLLASLFGCASQVNWQRCNVVPHTVGPLTLHEDGTYAFGPFRFDQATSLEQTKIGGAMVNKPSGEGETLRIDTPAGQRLLFRFEQGSWSYVV